MVADQKLYFGLAHARPTEANVDPDVRAARGAWFEALALADDEGAFERRVAAGLEEMAFELLEVTEIRPFGSMLEEGPLAPSLLELANAAAYENQTRFGPFNLYEEEGDGDGEHVLEDDPAPLDVLRQSMEQGVPLRLRREAFPTEGLEGFVVGVGQGWVLLHEVDGAVELNGYAAVPLADVFDAWLLDEELSIVERVFRLRKLSPRPLNDPPLDSAADLLRWADAANPLISVFVERDIPDVCYIGRVQSFGADEFTLSTITTGAQWENDETFRYDAVTRVDFGGKYEDALALVAASTKES